MARNNRVDEIVSEFLEFAAANRSGQGVKLLRLSLESLRNSRTESEVLESLKRLNRGLVGIEAHGHFTSKEFAWVEELRKIERSWN